MNKKNILYVLPALLLMVIAAYLYYQRTTSTLSFKESQLFEFDTSKVDHINLFFGDRTIQLEKTRHGWKVNEMYNLDRQKLIALYEAHHRLSFKSPASEQMNQRLSEIAAKDKIRVRIQGAGKTREFIMVYDSLGQTGTYVTIPGRDSHFQVFLPGYPRDNLTYLYPESIEFWRDKTLLTLKSDEISTVSVNYPERPNASFRLSLQNGAATVSNLQNQMALDVNDVKNVNQYLAYFASVRFESTPDTLRDEEVADIENSQPEAVFIIKKTDGNTIQMEVFNKMLSGQESKLDPNRVYVKHSDFENLMIVTFIEIAPLLKDFDYFRQNQNS